MDFRKNRTAAEKLINELIPGDRSLRDEPLQAHTTLRIGGPADHFVRVSSIEELSTLTRRLKEAGIPCFLLGRGSNVLVSDSGFRGVVIRLEGEFESLTARREGDHILLEAGAGVPMPGLCSFALKNNAAGLEFASGIPGSLGGGIVMNAGAYGGELKDVVKEVLALNENGETVRLSGEEMDFGYRSSLAKKRKLTVLKTILSLEPGEADGIREKMKELNGRRAEKQPLEYPSAGSTFKRPPGSFAGKLIEEAGLRGFCLGGAQVSEKHCGFLINRGDATASDFHRLMELVRERVLAHSGILLEPEVILLGDF